MGILQQQTATTKPQAQHQPGDKWRISKKKAQLKPNVAPLGIR